MNLEIRGEAYGVVRRIRRLVVVLPLLVSLLAGACERAKDESGQAQGSSPAPGSAKSERRPAPKNEAISGALREREYQRRMAEIERLLGSQAKTWEGISFEESGSIAWMSSGLRRCSLR